MSLDRKNRFGLYMDLLQSANYFKLVCGAGNEDKNEVEYLTYVYHCSNNCSIFNHTFISTIIVNSALQPFSTRETYNFYTAEGWKKL